MAGCSIVVLSIIMAPAMLVISIGVLVCMAAMEFVTSAAFPCLVGAVIFSGLAVIDVVRLLWRHHREKDAFPLTGRLFVRPAILCVVAAVLFVAMCVIAGSMLLAFWNELTASTA